MKLVVALCLFAALGFAATLNAQELVQPAPALSPEDVVRTQLRALQKNDVPAQDSGIRQVWEFAHHVNRRMTGPFDRFAEMLKGPLYQALIDHSLHDVKLLGQTTNAASFDVDVTTASGLVLRYRWDVERAFGGGLDGSWMTVSVSIATSQGREI